MIKNIIAVLLFLTGMVFAQHTWACSFIGDPTIEDPSDNLVAEKNFIFIGKVDEFSVTPPSTGESCVVVSFTPLEIIFGKEPEYVGFKTCGNDHNEVIQNYEYLKELDLKIGAKMLVGLKENNEPVDGTSITSELRPLGFYCFPALINIDNAPNDSVSKLLNELKARIEEEKANSLNVR